MSNVMVNVAVEKLLTAKEMGLETHPFKIDKRDHQVWLEDEEGDVLLARYKEDFKTPTKVYTATNMSDYEWWDAMSIVCQEVIDEKFAKDADKDRRIKALLKELSEY